jgi:hypothetical protein
VPYGKTAAASGYILIRRCSFPMCRSGCDTGGRVERRRRHNKDGYRSSNPAIDDERFSEFFRFDPHAHFVAFVVHIAALFEKRKDTINFRRLVKEMEQAGLISVQNAAEVDALLTRAQPFASKVTILRSNLFAHRSATLSYADAFKKAAVTAKQLCYLTNVALKIANRLLIVRGRNDQFFNALPANHADAILRVLSRSPAEGSKSKRSAQIQIEGRRAPKAGLIGETLYIDGDIPLSIAVSSPKCNSAT